MRQATRQKPRLPLPVALLGAALLVPAAAFAQDPPHWTSPERLVVDCTSNCHLGHHAQGGALTAAASNVNVCLSCHNAVDNDFPIAATDAALPGTKGTSHAFDVPAVNATYSTQTPLDTQMSLRVMGGNVVCSTCHNQHRSDPSMGDTVRIQAPKKTNDLTGTGVITAGGTYSGTESAWFALKVTTAGNETTSRFQYRKYTQGGGWTAWSSDRVPGTDVLLEDGITVSFGAGSYDFDERWEFYAAWSFLRASLDDGDNAAGSKLCRDCHRDWVWNPADVVTHTPGVRKGHPVGMPLGGGLFDRAVPLDGNGVPQGDPGADTNSSNDLRFDASGNVQCLTCHAVHFADSNTLTGG